MKPGIRAVLVATALYAVLVLLGPVLSYGAGSRSFALRVGVVLLFWVGSVAALAVGSAWIVKRSGERDVLLPALAWWLGWNLGVLVFFALVIGARGLELLALMVRSLSFGFLVPVDSALSPISVITVGDVAYGLGVPWFVLVIYAAVFWRRWRCSAPEVQG